MTSRQHITTVRRLRALVTVEAARNLTDSELVDRFAADQDETAFAMLVHRHGAMVFTVCRHVLGHEQDAEDAFQATFLVLARKAASIRKLEAVASWLHGVAYRCALQIQRVVARRRAREEEPLTDLPQRQSSNEAAWRELQAVLDEELQCLPAKYRSPFVLCCLEGLSRAEAARQLGWKEGTVAGRLAEARKLLQQRLARRGVLLSAVLSALALSSRGATAAVPAALVQATVRAALSLAVGQAAMPEAVAVAVEKVTRTLVLARIKVAALLVCVVSLLAGAGAIAHRVLAAEQAEEKQEAEYPAPREQRPGSVQPKQPAADLLPAGAIARLGTRRLCGGFSDPSWVGFSPDGTKVAARGLFGVAAWDAATGRRLTERADYKDYNVVANVSGWRADGTGVAVVVLKDGSYFVSAFTDAEERIPTPPAARPGATPLPHIRYLALAPDATRLAVVRTPDAKQFTIDLLPAIPGQPVAALKPERTLGPFPGPCRDIRYTERGQLVTLHGPGADKEDWSVALIDSDKNAVIQTSRIPPPGYCPWQYMLSLSADARLAAVLPRTRNFPNEHDGTIRVWDLLAGKELWKFPFPTWGYGTGHAFSPDGKHLVAASDKTNVQVWDLTTGKDVARSSVSAGELSGRGAEAVGVSRDGKRFATARKDGRVDIWDTATGKAVVPLATHRDEVETVAVSPDGQLVVTRSFDDSIRVWELTTGNPRCLIAAPRGKDPTGRFWTKHRLAFAPDRRGLLFTAAGELTMADPTTGKPLDLPGRLRNQKGHVGGFAADGRTLATFADDKVTLWDWPAGTVRATVVVPIAATKNPAAKPGPETAAVNLVALSPDGRLLFTNSVRGNPDPSRGWIQNTNDIWDAGTGKHLHRLAAPESWYPPAAFSSDSRVMYLGGHSLDDPPRGRQRIDALTAWDPVAGRLLRRFPAPDLDEKSRILLPGKDFGLTIYAVAVSPDGRLLAAASGALWSDGSVRLYETASGKFIKKLSRHAGEVTDMAFSPDGRRLVSVSKDQTGLVWDVSLPALGGAPGGAVGGARLAEAWDRLSAPEAAPAYAGMAVLAAARGDAVPFLRARLHSAPVPTDADLDRLVAQLDAAAFADRQKASAELERFGPNAVAGVKARLARTRSQEVRNWLTRFLAQFDAAAPSAYRLRCVRGVAVLEAIGTTEARALLAELAKGPAADDLTREAQTANRRGGRR